jgi:hypothetical protein
MPKTPLAKCEPTEPADEPACRVWAELEILADRAFIILQTIGIIDRAGNPKRLLTDFRQLRQAQLAYEPTRVWCEARKRPRLSSIHRAAVR